MIPVNQFSQSATMADVIRERPNDVAAIEKLQTEKLDGRIQTLVRAVPSTPTDVLPTDGEGDVVIDSTYIYTLIRISGILKWDRRAHSVGW